MAPRYAVVPDCSAIFCCSAGEFVRASWYRSGAGRERIEETWNGVWYVCDGEGNEGGKTGNDGIESGVGIVERPVELAEPFAGEDFVGRGGISKPIVAGRAVPHPFWNCACGVSL